MEFVKIKTEKVDEGEKLASTTESKTDITVQFPPVNTIQPAAVIKTENVDEDENLRSFKKTKQTSKHDAGDSLTINAVGQQQNTIDKSYNLTLTVKSIKHEGEAVRVLPLEGARLNNEFSTISSKRSRGRPRKTIIKKQEYEKPLSNQIKPKRESGRPRKAPIRYDPKKEEAKSTRNLRLRQGVKSTSEHFPVKRRRSLPSNSQIDKNPFVRLEILSVRKLGQQINRSSLLSRHSSSSSSEKSSKETKPNDFHFIDNLLKPTDKKHKCPQCPKSFHHRAHLKVHELIHTDERPHQCHICEKRFKQNTSLNQHLRTHSKEKPYQCILCKKRFIQQAVLNQHILKHTGERPYQCKLCDKSYIQQSNLNDHMRSKHTFEKPFKCPICQKLFRFHTARKNHMLIHTNNKPFWCPLCPKKFKSMQRLRAHQERCHEFADYD